MALKPGRKYAMGTDIHYFMNVVAERGIIVVHDTSTTGVGEAMDDADAIVRIPTGSGDGDPAGLLLNDVVNLDLTRQHINWHKDEVQIGGKVTVLTHGWVVTNMIASGDSPKAGDKAYFDADGELTTSAGSDQVGKFLSGKDSDGYAKVDINIP
jgi:hypothetical protein